MDGWAPDNNVRRLSSATLAASLESVTPRWTMGERDVRVDNADDMTGLGAATLVLIALLPGALFVWSFERWAGRFGIGLQDRALRFVGGSAVLLSITAGPLYWLYANYWDSVANRQALPPWFWTVPILYTIVPLVAGGVLGFGWKANWSWARLVSGRDRTPRAWDHLFQDRPAGGIRCKLKSGTWIGGVFGEVDKRRPYAAGYPEPQDLYLAATLRLDPHTGEILTDDDSDPEIQNSGLLLRWERDRVSRVHRSSVGGETR